MFAFKEVFPCGQLAPTYSSSLFQRAGDLGGHLCHDSCSCEQVTLMVTCAMTVAHVSR